MADAVAVTTAGLPRTDRAITLARPLWWLALLTMLFGVARIVVSNQALSVTFDEPAHIAAGMQLLDKGEFTYEPLHPPLARVAVALGPYLAGYRSQNGGDMWIEGRRMLYGQSAHPDAELLTLARLGILPFFLACLALVWLWTGRHLGGMEAALAVILFGNLPLLLAHAGLATTDMAFTATFTAAFFAFLFWLEQPSAARGLVLGTGVALAVATKLSALLFLPAAFGIVLLYRWVVERGEWSPGVLIRAWRGWLAAVTSFLVAIWAVYGCKADPLYGLASLVSGIRELTEYAEGGEASYFLGEIREHGSWAFFPVLILVKTPLPFLLALAIGTWQLGRFYHRDWRRMAPLLGAAAIIASVVPSPINIGLRHILPAFPLMAIVAGVGLARLLSAGRFARQGLAIAGLLISWQIVEAAAAHPDYLPYFNQLAAGAPERIVVGSDLDWGQDLRRLRAELNARRITNPHLAIHTSADLRKHDFPPFTTMYPGEPTTGWIAISQQVRAFYCAGYAWLDPYLPVARIGKSILLYNVPGPPTDPGPPDNLRRFNWQAPQPCSRRTG